MVQINEHFSWGQNYFIQDRKRKEDNYSITKNKGSSYRDILTPNNCLIIYDQNENLSLKYLNSD